MAGTSCEDENKCIIFSSLTEKYKEYNRATRLATEKGREFPDYPNSLCGGCMQTKIVKAALSQRLMDLIPH